MSPRPALTRTALVLLLLGIASSGAACSSTDRAPDPDRVESAPGASAGSADPTESPSSQGEIVEYGVGQSDQYAAGMVVVKNLSDHGGQTVTASANFLDAKGDIITTETQVESFAYAGQTVALQVYGDLGSARTKVASIEPTLLVEDDGTFDESDVKLEPLKATSITEQYGTYSAKFLLQNPTSDALEGVRIGIVCKNSGGDIIGGGTAYPDLLPPSGQIVVTADFLTVSGKPASCTAYPSPAGF